ncbi:hypothetical protein V9T40_014683 [Parthenolecanium corni]|uniref:DNA mismatch repair proteins mutS family domain-containing protein n=1 Tax=Parthenolecanium corni TaxID=536013 RepID=A0AAN9T4D3_9HEMI
MSRATFLNSTSPVGVFDAEGRNIYLQQNSEQTILSVFWRCGKLGAAVFSTETIEVKLLNDIADTGPDFSVCCHLIRNIQPTSVISCNTLSASFLDLLKKRTANCETTDSTDLNSTKIPLNLLANKHFQFERCKARVLGMNVEGKMTDLHEDSRTNFLQSILNFNCRMMISALGALLYFADSYVSKVLMQIPSQHVASIQTVSLDSLVWIDEETYNALEIFSSNSHSTVYRMANMNSKDGFSIHALFNRCWSPISSRYMRILLSHPTKDIDELMLRHEVIEFFLKNENQIILKNLQECLKNVCNSSAIIARIVGTQATPSQWKSFYKTIHNVITINEICRSRSEIKFFKSFCDTMDQRLYHIAETIDSVIDFEQSLALNKFKVKVGAFPDLDEIRKSFEDIPSIMEEVATVELANLPENIKSCMLVYLPEMGYLLGIPLADNNLTEGNLAIPDVDYKFTLAGMAHFKTAICEEMDRQLGDSQLILLKHETEIMYQISKLVRESLPAITKIFEKIRQLDCLIALSDVAREFELVKPTLTTDRVINIKQGRHILQQLCVNTFVANDFVSSPEESLIKVFTGPNSSGKSVYLKQVALIVYLAHIGSFVPAEVATISIMDYLHARIHTVESISTAMSSFMLDLRQMYSCLKYSSPNSLIVIDEFGKGTADIDGLALLAASVLHFLQRDARCPHVVVSTHFHRLITFLPTSDLIKPQTLEFILQNEEITYLYAVKDGAVQSSFAHLAAINAGISKHIVQRSNEILSIEKNGGSVRRKTENQRTKLMKKREECLQNIMKSHLQTDDDLREIIGLLNGCR